MSALSPTSPFIDSSCLYIRALQPQDATQCYQISSKKEIGWDNTQTHWQQDIAASQGLAFAVIHTRHSEDTGQIIATAIGVSFGRKLRIMDILVDPAYQGQKLGKTIFYHLLKQIEKINSQASLELEASTAGRYLYRKYDFKDDYEVSSFIKQACAKTNEHFNSVFFKTDLTDKECEEIEALDKTAFGCTRAELIKKIALTGKRVLLYRPNEKLEGFLFYSSDNNGVTIGPWINQDVKGSEILLKAALQIISQEFPSKTVSVHTAHQLAIKILTEQGFSKADFTTFHMHCEKGSAPQKNHETYYSIWSFGYG